MIRSMSRPRPMSGTLIPMIDVVFQLIVFFLLTSQLSAQRAVDVDLPSPELNGQAGESDAPCVINVIPVDQVASFDGAFRMGTVSFPESPAGIAALEAELRAILTRTPDTRVVIRADRSEGFSRASAALRAAARAGFKGVELAITDAPNQR